MWAVVAAEPTSFDAARRHHARGLSYIGVNRTGQSRDSRSLFGISDAKTLQAAVMDGAARRSVFVEAC